MEHLPLKLIVACCIVVLATEKPIPSNCYGDVCNVNNEHQYCSEKFKYCRNCEEVIDDCGSVQQPLECTGYCIDIAVKKALNNKEKKGLGCVVVSMMLNINNGVVTAQEQNSSFVNLGTNLTYSCNDGYDLQGPSTIACIENGMWNPTTLPYCLDNTYLGYKRAAIALSIISAGCILGLAIVIIKCLKLKKKKKESISRQSTGNSLEDCPLMNGIKNESDRDNTPSFQIGTENLTHSDAKENGLPIPPPSLSNPPYVESDTKEKDEAKKHVETKSGLEQGVPGIKIELVLQNEVQVLQQNNSPQNPPDTRERSPRQNEDPKYERSSRKGIDEKRSTEESRDTNFDEVAADGKKHKGTEPLPSRDEELKPFQQTLKEKGSKGPEAIPTTEDNIKLSTDETNQGQMTKKVGIKDITFAKSDISDRHRKPLGPEAIELPENKPTSQEMFKMKGVEDIETVPVDDSAQDPILVLK